MYTTEELLNIASKKLLSITQRPDIVMEKGQGMYLWDVDGKKYLDFIGGWAVCCLGHSPQNISDVLTKQSQQLINSSPSFYNKPMLEFTDLLLNNSVFDRVWYGNSGAEVNEAAIKLARKYGMLYKNSAYKVISTTNGFHGRTLAMMTATGKDHWKGLFNPKPEGFIHVPFNDIDSIKSVVDSETVAIIIEPIQGEGGVNVASKKYLSEIKKICEENDLLLIFDEIQTGYGRTGTLFAYEQLGIEPDIMTLAKGIGGGFPLSALLVKEHLNIFDTGEQGGTFGGQQLAMAVGYSVLKEIIKHNILDNVKNMGKYILDVLYSLKDEFNISNIRGRGLLIGMDLPYNSGKQIVDECLKRGLIINSPKEYMIRFMPPLIVSKADIDNMITILKEVLLDLGYKKEK